MMSPANDIVQSTRSEIRIFLYSPKLSGPRPSSAFNPIVHDEGVKLCNKLNDNLHIAKPMRRSCDKHFIGKIIKDMYVNALTAERIFKSSNQLLFLIEPTMDEYNSEDDEMKVPEVKSISEPQTGSVKVIKEENQSDARLRSDHFTVEIVSCQGISHHS